MPRDTRTGSVLEQMIVPALKSGGCRWQTQVNMTVGDFDESKIRAEIRRDRAYDAVPDEQFSAAWPLEISRDKWDLA